LFRKRAFHEPLSMKCCGSILSWVGNPCGMHHCSTHLALKCPHRHTAGAALRPVFPPNAPFWGASRMRQNCHRGVGPAAARQPATNQHRLRARLSATGRQSEGGWPPVPPDPTTARDDLLLLGFPIDPPASARPPPAFTAQDSSLRGQALVVVQTGHLLCAATTGSSSRAASLLQASMDGLEELRIEELEREGRPARSPTTDRGARGGAAGRDQGDVGGGVGPPSALPVALVVAPAAIRGLGGEGLLQIEAWEGGLPPGGRRARLADAPAGSGGRRRCRR
jgi:hypothetical protein